MPLPPRVDDLSSNDDFDNPPEASSPRQRGPFEDLVNSSPGSVAPLLKRFHARRDPKRYALAEEIHCMIVLLYTPDEVMDGFMGSNLPSVLMDIASDPSLYGKFRHDETAKRYGFHILRSLSSIIRTDDIETSATVQSSIVGAGPKLWKTLWNKRSLLFDPEPTLADEKQYDSNFLSGALVQMGHRLSDLGGHNSLLKNDSSYLAHFMLYAWMMGCRHRFLALNTVNTIVCHNTDEAWKNDFFHAALVEPDLVEKFSDACRYEFVSSDVIRGDLHEALVIHHFACGFCYPVLRHEAMTPPPGIPPVMHNIAVACQRNICMGQSKFLLSELMPGLMSIVSLMEQSRGFLNKWKRDHLEDMQLIGICAKLFPHAAASGQYIFVETLTKICYVYASNYETEMKRLEDQQYGTRVKAALFLVWRATLEELQSLSLDDEGLVDYTKANWLDIGGFVGLDPATNNPEEDAFNAASKHRRIRVKRCQYVDCMCSFHSPQHTMKICTGCWRARYCSVKCQASDWQAGHRELCLSRQERL
ncbi:hypothetical protein QCA50_005374 [Cerrena zonata]|uniref:MYND-type domain-containing protein n=1 Tax=Cerrena zonata TaxID=2478898 RepID=A0AAW0GLE5_9APHY